MKSQIIQGVTQLLTEVFEQHKNSGLVSIYLWGSILTDDFNITTSDIDSIGVVKDDFPLKLEQAIQSNLQARYPNNNKFGFRIIYLSELNGEVIKSNLTRVINPKLLLHDFTSWKHVCGEELISSNFLLPIPSREEAIMLSILELENRLANGEVNNQYIIKGVARLVDYCQGQRLPTEPFEYSRLSLNISGDLEKNVVDAILECKRSQWDESVYNKNIPIFQQYIQKQKVLFQLDEN